MNPTLRPRLLALSITAFFAAPAFAQQAPAQAGGDAQVKQLDAVTVSAKLDEARNTLSPTTGGSQYNISAQTIQALPQGDSTPLNQVILQAPGMVQDSLGQVHARGDHANLQYRINGVIIPESISGFGQTLDARTVSSVKLLDGALPAQFGLRSAAVVDITTKDGHALGDGGSIGITGGSFGTVNPNASIWGSSGRWSWFLTANYLESDVGIENPTSSRKPIHDKTQQLKSFGDVSYVINDDTRLSLLFGTDNNRFEIPNNPNQQPAFGYLDQTDFNSADLNERQNEKTAFAVLSLQGKIADTTDYQISLGERYSSLDYLPDAIGDLMFNGVAANISRSNHASTLQADFATPLGDNHTLRYGAYADYESAPSDNTSWVFPTDAAGNVTSTTPFAITDDNRVIARTYSLYVQDGWNIGDRFTLNYGLRGDAYYAFGGHQNQLSPRIGAVWQASDSTTVHAGYSRYFTPPATEAITTSSIAKFDNTTNAVHNYGNNTPLAERDDYLDLGVMQQVGANLSLGLDAYYKKAHDYQDEGQFGAALVYSTFNYEKGLVRGVEFSANYQNGPLSAYFNFTASEALGKNVVTSQYNFEQDDLDYIATHYIHADHDQRFTSSGGINYAFGGGNTKVGADYLFGSGLRADSDIPNGAQMPSYFQLNLDVSHDFTFASTGKLHTQLALVNALDRTYELHDGTSIGLGAPQYGPRRGVYLTLQKDF